MSLVTIAISKSQEDALRLVLSPKQLKQSIYQAVKRTVDSGAVQVRRDVQETINVTTKGAARVIAGKVASDGRSGTIRISKKPMPLGYFRGVRQTKRGVVVTTLKGKPPLRLRHAFLATVGSGHNGVFVRGAAKAKRLPIKQRYGPSAYGLLVEANRMTSLGESQSRKLVALFQKNLQSQIARWMK